MKEWLLCAIGIRHRPTRHHLIEEISLLHEKYNMVTASNAKLCKEIEELERQITDIMLPPKSKPKLIRAKKSKK